jgi:5S rRNA maturation endonuclease (ribonuclease M5)
MERRYDPEWSDLLIRILRDLKEINRLVPIIVEGKRDRHALRRLGFSGEIILLHTGKGLYEFSEEILRRYDRVVILLDWDQRGSQLYQKLTSLLKGHYEEFAIFRDTLISLCSSEIQTVEEIPRILNKILRDSLGPFL